MCGKFTQMASWQEVHAFSRPIVAGASPDEVIVATPMRFAKIMRLNASGERELVSMRWGFAGKDDATPSRPKHMHARGETIDKKPTFSHAFAHGRGILLVHTFNEGEELANGKTKQWVITPKDGQPIAIAVICEEWTNGEEKLLTFIQVTTPANALPHAGNSAAGELVNLARGDGGIARGGESAAHDIRGRRQLDHDGAGAIEAGTGGKSESAAGSILEISWRDRTVSRESILCSECFT
jgi:hypothetical protein